MTKYQWIFFLFVITNIGFAQSNLDKTIYLDSLWKETTKENCKYYRIVKDYYSHKEIYRIQDYYKNGTLQMEGNSKSRDAILSEGEVVYYYENGNKKNITTYIKGRPSGKSFSWYENGNKKAEQEYITQEKDELKYDLITHQYWQKDNKQTVINGNGFINEKGDKIQEKGNIKNGYRDGIWEGTDSRYKISFTENYQNGKLNKGTSIDSMMVKNTYYEVFDYPKPKRGMQHFYNYLAKKFIIPKDKQNISGKILLTFIINKDGGAENIKIAKTLDEVLDNKAIRLINEYPEWESGKYRGVTTKVEFSIPIRVEASR